MLNINEFLYSDKKMLEIVKIGSWSMEKIFIFQLKMKKLLLLDNATTHKTSKIKDKINECETALSVIPSDLT